jgi:hypothetical protein
MAASRKVILRHGSSSCQPLAMTQPIPQKLVGAVGFEGLPTVGIGVYRCEMDSIREVPFPGGDLFFKRTLQNACNGAWIDGENDSRR